MKFNKILLYTSFIILHSSLCFSQEHVVPLRTNPTLINYVRQQKKLHGPNWRQTQDSIVDLLPFLDDFSKPGPYPDTSKWMDNAAFINFDYPVCPHTLGVATMDGLNNEGLPYNPTAIAGYSYPADSLTSRPIDLTWNYNTKEHNLKQGDSVWFSFYYQPGGLSPNPPFPSDSLLLQFRTSQVGWTTVWYHLGYSPNPGDTNFHIVMVPILNPVYSIDSSVQINPFDANFQFRFKNYACTSAMVDQWNIDEVYINLNRTAGDTTQKDVSFGYESPSLLANYQYMPWKQFTKNDLVDSMHTIFIRNNNYSASPANADINETYYYVIPQQPDYPTATTYNSGAFNLPMFYCCGWDNDPVQIHPPIKSKFNYTSLTGPANITITHGLQTGGGDFDIWNDTLRFTQVFSDYFAYDDGTAEAAYFINGEGQPSSLAYQFTLNTPDTLIGLGVYFVYNFVNAANYSFRLCLWDNSGPNGSPGVLKWEDDSIYSPRYSDSLNGFVYYPYHFHHDTIISANKPFYVGWIQTYGDSLNVGWDLNTNHSNMLYYNAGNTGWSPSSYSGSLMMRPYFGKNIYNGIPTIKKTPEMITLYPNPAQDEITIQWSVGMIHESSVQWSVLKVYGADGSKWIENDNFTGTKVNTSLLPTGVYILELNTPDGSTYYQKLFIQR